MQPPSTVCTTFYCTSTIVLHLAACLHITAGGAAGWTVDPTGLVSQIPIHAPSRPARPAPPRPARTTATLPNVQCRPPGFPAYIASSPHTNYCCLALRQVGLVPEVSIKAPPSVEVSPSDQCPAPPCPQCIASPGCWTLVSRTALPSTLQHTAARHTPPPPPLPKDTKNSKIVSIKNSTQIYSRDPAPRRRPAPCAQVSPCPRLCVARVVAGSRSSPLNSVGGGAGRH